MSSTRSSNASLRPKGNPDAPPRALVFDSSYDQYRGVVAFVRVVDGRFRTRDDLRAMAADRRFEAEARLLLSRAHADRDAAGEVEYVTGLKDVSRLLSATPSRARATVQTSRCPATRTSSRRSSRGSLSDGLDVTPSSRDALEKLKLNDASLFYEPETSQALGFGFRCGFLGLLHMEIVRERLEREFDLDLLVTAPNVAYRVYTQDGGGDRGAQPGRHAAGVRARRGLHPRDDDRPEGVRRLRHGAE